MQNNIILVLIQMYLDVDGNNKRRNIWKKERKKEKWRKSEQIYTLFVSDVLCVDQKNQKKKKNLLLPLPWYVVPMTGHAIAIKCFIILN